MSPCYDDDDIGGGDHGEMYEIYHLPGYLKQNTHAGANEFGTPFETEPSAVFANCPPI